MTVFLIILAFLLSLYGIIWVYLLYGFFRQQKHALNDFKAAWEGSTYTTKVKSSGFESLLHITFPSGNGSRLVKVNEEGEVTSNIIWESSGRENTKPSRLLRRRIEEYTKQIATMHKLEHGGFEEENEGGWS